MANIEQVSDAINQSIIFMAESDRGNLIALLKKSGYDVNESSTYDELATISFEALRDSAKFRSGLSNYINASLKQTENEVGFLNSVGRPPIKLDIDVLKSAEVKAQQMTTPSKPIKQGTKVGNFLRDLFPPEEIKSFARDTIKFGVELGKNKILQASQNKGNKQAIEFTKAEAEKLKQENIQAGLGTTGDFGQTTSKNKWILPVAIGGGVILIGVIIYFVTKKKTV